MGILNYIAPLYHLALTAFLDLYFEQELPEVAYPAVPQVYREKLEFILNQQTCERALIWARKANTTSRVRPRRMRVVADVGGHAPVR